MYNLVIELRFRMVGQKLSTPDIYLGDGGSLSFSYFRVSQMSVISRFFVVLL